MSGLVHGLNVLLVGLLVGNEFGSWAVVHRAVAELSTPEQVRAEQALTRRYGQLMPVLMVAGMASSGVASTMLAGRSGALPRTLRLAATACLASMLGITLVGNQPLNRATLEQEPGVDPRAWLALRGRWNRLHDWRLLLDLAAFVLAEALTIRAIAAACSVTPPAIYQHFADKQALLRALLHQQFGVFRAALDEAADGAGDACEALRRRCQGYVRFGLDQPGAYRVLFSGLASARAVS